MVVVVVVVVHLGESRKLLVGWMGDPSALLLSSLLLHSPAFSPDPISHHALLFFSVLIHMFSVEWRE